jgi:hypothetical protein
VTGVEPVPPSDPLKFEKYISVAGQPLALEKVIVPTRARGSLGFKVVIVGLVLVTPAAEKEQIAGRVGTPVPVHCARAVDAQITEKIAANTKGVTRRIII